MLLAPAARPIAEVAPGVDMVVSPLVPSTMEDLRRGEVDLAIGVFPDAPPEVRARRLFEDRAGALWVGSLGGLDRFDVDAVAPEAPDGPWPDFAGTPVRAVVEDGDGRLVVGGEGGVVRLAPDRRAVPEVEGAVAERVRTLAVDPDGPGGRPGVWVARDGAAPAFHPDGAGEPLAVGGLTGIGAIAVAVADADAWLATAAGLYRVDKADPDLRAVAVAAPGVEGRRRAALVDRAGRLWVGGDDGLAMRTVDGRWRRVHGGGTGILSLLEDRRGAIWVGTRFAGVAVLTPPRGLDAVVTSSPVRAVAGDDLGRLWIGDAGGSCPGDGPGEDCVPISGPGDVDGVFAVLPAGDGAWVGTRDALYRTSPGGPSRRFGHDPADPASLGPGAVRALDLDRSGRLWVALWGGGLSRLDPGGERFEHFRADAGRPFSLPSDRLTVLLRDGRGQLWIGGDAGLVRRTADGRFHSYRRDPADPTSLRGDAVRDLHQGPDGHLWVGTDAGLDRLPAELAAAPPAAAPNNRGFAPVDLGDGPDAVAVNAIEEDGDGRLWLATARGLVRFDPATGTALHLGRPPGPGPLLAGASWAAPDGRLYFGAAAGYITVNPGTFGTSGDGAEAVATPRIAALRDAGGARLAGTDPLRLPIGRGAVTVELADLDFHRPPSTRFAYRLAPGDDAWRAVAEDATFTVGGIRAGRHQLQIRGTDGDGAWSDALTTVHIRVDAPWWRSRWTAVPYAGAILGLLALLVAARRRSEALGRHVSDASRLTENRLQLALDGSGDGLWDWDLETGDVFRSGIAEMLGVDPGELPTDATWRTRWIHPEDRERVEGAIEAHLRGDSDRFEAEYRARDGGGAWRWILDRGDVVERAADGAPRRMAGTFKDLTRHKETERELRLWSTVFEAIDEGVMVLSRDGRVQAVNDAFCYLFGRHRHSLLGRPVDRLRSAGHDVAFYRRLRREILVYGRWSGEIRQLGPDGSERLVWMEMRSVADPGPGKGHGGKGPGGPVSDPRAAHRPKAASKATVKRTQLSHYVVVVNDITRRKRAEEELRYLADYDA
ncbi:MAG: two-component regulator propeller domain-containing protein, partial [Acidobacteriota bacterium]